jgi:tetratricopeptide (TPR) repeat protein
MGATLSSLGRYEEALFYLTKTLEIGKELNAGIGLWFPLRNIGDLYIHLSELDKAEAVLLQALSLARQFKNRLLEEATLTTLISVPAGRKQYQAALDYAHQAAVIDAEVKHPGARYELLTDTGFVYQEIGDYQKAIELYQQAMEIARSSGTALAEAVITSNIGACQKALGQPEEALATQVKAREIIDKMGESAYPVEEAMIDWRIALVQEALGQDKEALKVFYDSMNQIDRARAGAVRTESAKAAIGASNWRLFFDAIELLLKLNRTSDAFAVAERYRARAFLNLLAEERVDLRRELTAAQRKQEETLSDNLSAIQKELFKQGVTPERRLQLGSDRTAAENDLDAFHLELRHENPRYAGISILQRMR